MYGYYIPDIARSISDVIEVLFSSISCIFFLANSLIQDLNAYDKSFHEKL